MLGNRPHASWRGHLRTNAIGVDLNREWKNPSPKKSPEVYHVRKRMEQTGVNFFLDIHGDEEIPHNFVSGLEGIPSITPELLKLQKQYEQSLRTANPDFHPQEGYKPDKPGEADLNIASNFVAEHFKCLALTLEQHYKDEINNSHPGKGWSPERSKIMGAANITAINDFLNA